MKKFNVPTQMDCILKLITSDKRKPHFTRKGEYIKAKVRRDSCVIWVIYNTRLGSLRVHITSSAPWFKPENITRWELVYYWAKRVDANRYRWDK